MGSLIRPYALQTSLDIAESQAFQRYPNLRFVIDVVFGVNNIKPVFAVYNTFLITSSMIFMRISLIGMTNEEMLTCFPIGPNFNFDNEKW